LEENPNENANAQALELEIPDEKAEALGIVTAWTTIVLKRCTQEDSGHAHALAIPNVLEQEENGKALGIPAAYAQQRRYCIQEKCQCIKPRYSR